MTSGIAAIHVKRQRGKVCVLGMGQTPRGQRYLAEIAVLSAERIEDLSFKAGLATAIKQIMAEEGSNSQ